MRIGELSKSTRVPSSTIRFYESKGLLPPAQRSANGYRTYDQSATARLQLIRFAQSLGFTLDELPTLLKSDEDWDHKMIRLNLQQKYEEADFLVTELEGKKKRIINLMGQLENRWSQSECMSDEELESIISSAKL